MFIRYSYLLLLSIFILAVSSCDIFSNNDSYNGDTTIRGIVVAKSDSIPLDSVLLTISYSEFMGMSQWQNLEPLTDSTGCFDLEIYCMESYSYKLYFSKEGYTYNDYPKPIDPGKDNYFEIEMEKRDSVKVE